MLFPKTPTTKIHRNPATRNELNMTSSSKSRDELFNNEPLLDTFGRVYIHESAMVYLISRCPKVIEVCSLKLLHYRIRLGHSVGNHTYLSSIGCWKSTRLDWKKSIQVYPSKELKHDLISSAFSKWSCGNLIFQAPILRLCTSNVQMRIPKRLSRFTSNVDIDQNLRLVFIILKGCNPNPPTVK